MRFFYISIFECAKTIANTTEKWCIDFIIFVVFTFCCMPKKYKHERERERDERIARFNFRKRAALKYGGVMSSQVPYIYWALPTPSPDRDGARGKRRAAPRISRTYWFMQMGEPTHRIQVRAKMCFRGLTWAHIAIQTHRAACAASILITGTQHWHDSCTTRVSEHEYTQSFDIITDVKVKLKLGCISWDTTCIDE